MDLLETRAHIILNMFCFSLFFSRIISENNGIPPLTFKRFQSILSKLDSPDKPEDPVTADTVGKAKSQTTDEHDEKYGVPTLEELG